MLTHYTKSPEAVANILVTGFAWIPNRRKLAELLIPQHDFSKMEPQQFGMVSFTELRPAEATNHRHEFGTFGIVVSDSWASHNNAQRVVYVDDRGPFTDALRDLFAVGYQDLSERIRFPLDGFWRMAYHNKNVAAGVAGATLWARLLQLWEFLEPASSSQHREWRIVNPHPFYGLSHNKQEAIARVSPPQGWAKYTNVLPVTRQDVEALVCRSSDCDALGDALPEAYRDLKFVQVEI